MANYISPEITNNYIGIWYTYGDIEDPVKVPEGKDPFDYMIEIALKEVKVSVIESEDTVTIEINKDEDDKEIIDLTYHRDDDHCYYKLFNSKKECQDFLDRKYNYDIE